jgi:hypothetical protein
VPGHPSRSPNCCLRACALSCLTAAGISIQGCDSWGEGQVGRPLAVSHTIGEVGSSPGQFLYPRALAADGQGWSASPTEGPHLWVIDKAGRIQRLDATTGRASIAFRAPEIALGRPCGVTLGPSWRGGPEAGGGDAKTDLLYVADTHYHRVLIYAPPAGEMAGRRAEPRLVGEFGRYGRGPGEFIYVTDVAILTDDQGYAIRLYVAEYGGNDRISIWEPAEDGDLRWVSAFGIQGDGRGSSSVPGAVEFDRPQSLAIDRRRGRLVVTDSCNHRVGVFTLDGDLVRWIDGREAGQAGPPPLAVENAAVEGDADDPDGWSDMTLLDGNPQVSGRGMAYPFGLHLLEDGTALVTEYGHHRVRHFDVETGQVLGLYGIGGRGKGELLNPWAVTMIGRTVYVLDSGNERIQAFTLPRRGGRVATGGPGGGGGMGVRDGGGGG